MNDAGGGTGFAAALHGFACAAAARPRAVRTETGSLAGTRLTLSLVGEALAEAVGPSLLPLAPIDAPTRRREASLKLWDCAATGIPPPAVPDGDAVSEGDGWRVSSHAGGRYLCEDRPTGQLWLDQETGQLIGCTTDARSMGAAARARPLQRMMSVFCRALDVQEIHAGMVARDGAGILLLGAGGQGKSTTALDGLHAGLDFIGDDSIAIGADGDDRVRGYCLYASARVLPRQTDRWPRFAGEWLVSNPPEPKLLLLPGTMASCRIAPSARIVAIALPVVTGRGIRVVPTANANAIHALIHDSRDHYARFGLTPTEFARFARLARSVPCFRFEVDDDPGRVAMALDRLIEAHA